MDEYTGFGKRDLNAEHHWQNIEARGVLKKHRRKVVIFPGDGTDTDRAANGFAKIIDSVFPENEKPEMYSLIYRDNSSCYSHRLYMQANTNHLNDSRYPLGRAPQPYLDTFYQEQILPLISQKDGTERIALEEAAQYLRATTIGTHCHGSTVLLDIENKLKQSMQTLGYSKSEQDFLLKQIVSINFCSSMPLEQTQTSALHIISQADGQAVANWRFGSLNHFIQTKKLARNETALFNTSDNEKCLVLRNIYDLDTGDKINGATPDEHLGRLYFHFDLNSQYRTSESTQALQFVHQTMQAIVSAPVSDNMWQYMPQTDNRKVYENSGKKYYQKFQKRRQLINQAEEKLWQTLNSGHQLDLTKLPMAPLFLRRNPQGKTPFEQVIQNGNVDEIKQIYKSIKTYETKEHDALLPARLLNKTIEYAAQNKRFDIANCFIAKGATSLPLQLQADKIAADDIPAMLPILEKLQTGGQITYTLLPIYAKSFEISNLLQKRQTQQFLKSMVFLDKTSLSENASLYQFCEKFENPAKQEMQKEFINKISEKLAKTKDAYDIVKLERARQATDSSHNLYEGLSKEAKIRLEQFSHKIIKQKLNECAREAITRGHNADFPITLFYCRNQTPEQRQAFDELITKLNQAYLDNPSQRYQLIEQMKDEMIKRNPSVFQTAEKVSPLPNKRIDHTNE